MSDVYLVGASSVAEAAHRIERASSTMVTVASSFGEVAMRFERALDDHARRIEEAIDRFIAFEQSREARP